MAQSTYKYDLLSIGECLVEFSRSADGNYRATWAGDAVNTLFYAARLGLHTGFISSFGDDLFTPMIREGIREEGIDCTLSEVVPGRRNGLYVIELDEEGEYTFHFWRKDSAATETLIRCDPERLYNYCARSRSLLFSGITLAVMKGRERLHDLLLRLHKSHSTEIIFDTNYRPALWSSPEEYRSAFEEIAPLIDLFLPSESDLVAVWPDELPEDVFSRYGFSRVAMKRGEKGCLLLWEGERIELLPVTSNPVVDATGAGDSFNSGFIVGLQRGWSPQDSARLGMQVAEHVIGVRGAIGREFCMDIKNH